VLLFHVLYFCSVSFFGRNSGFRSPFGADYVPLGGAVGAMSGENIREQIAGGTLSRTFPRTCTCVRERGRISPPFLSSRVLVRACIFVPFFSLMMQQATNSKIFT